MKMKMKEKKTYNVVLTEWQINLITSMLEACEPDDTTDLRAHLQSVLPKSEAYEVTWRTEVDATSHREAAHIARCMQRPGTTALHFVTQKRKTGVICCTELAPEDFGPLKFEDILLQAAEVIRRFVSGRDPEPSQTAVVLKGLEVLAAKMRKSC